MLQAHGKLVMG
jgi:hypothetical protein